MQRTKGFTLSELLVVIVIVVLLLGLAVPAFNLIKGSRSVDSAENQISALISRARADAIGLQKPFGVIFFIDPTSFTNSPVEGRVAVAEVMAADYPPAGSAPPPERDVYLDRVEGTDWLFLPAGVLAQTLNNGAVTGAPPARTTDGYLGYNQSLVHAGAATASGTFIGGVILFGGDGQLISRTWGYSLQDATGQRTRIADDLILPNGTAAAPFAEAGPFPLPAAAVGGIPRTSLGLALCDAAAFKHNGDLSDPQMVAGVPYAANGYAERGEEQWIDDNSTPLLINRYNGTLVRGE